MAYNACKHLYYGQYFGRETYRFLHEIAVRDYCIRRKHECLGKELPGDHSADEVEKITVSAIFRIRLGLQEKAEYQAIYQDLGQRFDDRPEKPEKTSDILGPKVSNYHSLYH